MAFEAVGTTVTFDSGFLAEITNIGFEQSREQIDVSHFGSTDYKEYIQAALQEPGELSCSIWFDPSLAPPLDSAPETVTIAWSNSGAATWAFTGFMINYSVNGGVGEAMSADCTIKATGAITVTP